LSVDKAFYLKHRDSNHGSNLNLTKINVATPPMVSSNHQVYSSLISAAASPKVILPSPVLSTTTTTGQHSYIPPAPPLPQMNGNNKQQQVRATNTTAMAANTAAANNDIQMRPIQDIQGRAKTVRIGKVRWPPPLRESETFENELQRRLALQRKIQEEICISTANETIPSSLVTRPIVSKLIQPLFSNNNSETNQKNNPTVNCVCSLSYLLFLSWQGLFSGKMIDLKLVTIQKKIHKNLFYFSSFKNRLFLMGRI
jgi:hypothetical protein